MATENVDYYIVRSGDTLNAIAAKTGNSRANLVKYNDIRNIHRLKAGEVLFLNKETAFSVQVLFIDALRHPIENLIYRIVVDRKAHSGRTPANGLCPELITLHARSTVQVSVRDELGNWHDLVTTQSGYGKKRITITSPYYSFKSKLEPHPPEAPIAPQPPEQKTPTPENKQPPLPAQPQGTPNKNNPNTKQYKKKGKKGESVIQIGIELPQQLLAYMQAYDGSMLSEDDWEKYAKDLGCEANVLKAIAQVESGGRDAFWIINDTTAHRVYAPKIMFERHYFSRLTGGRYDQTHPDISWPIPYRKAKLQGTHDEKMASGTVSKTDIRDNQQDYLRLINAYRLDDQAALQSASWGKFQVLGVNYLACGAKSIEEFSMSMCKSESGQIQWLAGFIRNKPRAWKDQKNKAQGKEISLWDAVKFKNWDAIAFNYNGPRYKENDYAKKMKDAYEAYCKSST